MTIRVVCKKNFLFHNPSATITLVNAGDKINSDEFFKLHPNKGDAQDAPDWIKDTKLFELALKDGSVYVVQGGPEEVQENSKQPKKR